MSRHHLCDDQDEVDCQVPLLSNDHDRHVPVLRDDPVSHSPAMSAVSAHSQELKFSFDPCPGQVDLESDADAHSDYSHVNIRPKPRHGDGSGYMARPPPPPYSHRYESLANARSGVHYGPAPNNVRLRSQPPPAVGSLEEASTSDPSRRRSWSPRQSAMSYQGGYRGARGCYSSNIVDWDSPSQPVNPPPYDSSSNYPPPVPPLPQSHLIMQGPPHSQPLNYSQNYLQSHPPRQVQGHNQGHLNNVAEVEGENIPPRLAPVSGVLSEKLSRSVIRPIAFKPAYARPQVNVCQGCREEGLACVCQNYLPSQSHSQYPARPDGPVYLRSPSLRSMNTSQMSVYSGSVAESSSTSNRSAGYNNETSILNDDSPGVNVDQSPTRRLPTASSVADVIGSTPSPSDSGVGELEAMLKEKETEILILRQVMDRNERAIFQVYEEKKNRWQQDLREIKEEYESRLRAQLEKASRLEQALSHGKQQQTHPKQNNLANNYSNLQVEKETLGAAAAGGVKINKNNIMNSNSNVPNNHNSSNQANHLTDSYHSEPESCQSSSTTTPKKHHSQSSRSSRSSRSSSIHSGDLEAEVTEEMAMKNTEIMALRAQLRTLQGQLQDKDRALAALREESASKSEELQLAREQIDRLLSSSRRGSSTSVHEEGTQTSVSDVRNIREQRAKVANVDDEEDEESVDDDQASSAPLLRSSMASDEEYILSLERQIDGLRGQLQAGESLLETERLQWLEEKNKVIRYQKQLQLNYVQMQRKNNALEAEVEQLTLELERRDLKLTALNGEEESVC